MPAAPALLDLAKESKALNSKVFSLTRLLLLSALAELPESENASFREMRAGLGLNDGVIYTNLNVLIDMGYVREERIVFDDEKMTAYAITREGREELGRIKKWLQKWIGEGI